MDAILGRPAPVEAAMAGTVDTGLLSPSPAFTPGTTTLNTFVYPDLYGTDAAPLNRSAAMAIPAVARNRHLVAGTIGRLPLEVWRGGDLLPDQPTWTYRTEHGLPPFHRMLWTVDDLIFHGWSLWVVRRGADGLILEAARIAIERWKFARGGVITVDGREVPGDQVILIPGPHEGILNFGRDALVQAIDLAKAAGKAAKNPNAYVDLHYTGDRPMDDTEVDALISRWAAARRGDNGGVAFTSKWVEAKEMGAASEHLLVEGRNAAAVDVARLISVPASMADATNAQASLTYETSQGRNAEFIDYGLALYMEPIRARLSMDDVVPRGQSVRFDTSELRDPAPSPTGPDTED